MELKNGTLLQGGKYKIEKKLGQGSFGITYLAIIQIIGVFGATQTETKVAVKEFFMKDINGRNGKIVTTGNKDGIFQNYKNRFIKEAKTLNSLKHPNIVRVIDLFEENNTVYYVMDYLDGGSLDMFISNKGTLSPYYTSSLFFQVSDALIYMHQHKMLHLDLKPSNIMLDSNGKAVIIDFGLTKHFSDTGEPESSTTVGTGTPGYAPIEQSNYKPELSDGFPATIDVYALGATLFKMLSGKRPPNASDILNEGFPKKELLNVPIDLVDIIELAMMPMKKQRIQNIEEFVELFPIIRNDNYEDYDSPKLENFSESRETEDATIVASFVANEKKQVQKFVVDQSVDCIKITYESSLVFGSYNLEVRLTKPNVYDRQILYIYGKSNFDKFISNFNKLQLPQLEMLNDSFHCLDGDYLEISCFQNDKKVSTSLIYQNAYGVGGNLGPNLSLVKSKIEKLFPSLDRHLRDVPLLKQYNKDIFIKNVGLITFRLNFYDLTKSYQTTYLNININDKLVESGTFKKAISADEYYYFIDSLFDYLQSSNDLRIYGSRTFVYIKPRFGSAITSFSGRRSNLWGHVDKNILKSCFTLIPYIDEILNHFNTYPDWERL